MAPGAESRDSQKEDQRGGICVPVSMLKSGANTGLSLENAFMQFRRLGMRPIQYHCAQHVNSFSGLELVLRYHESQQFGADASVFAQFC